MLDCSRRRFLAVTGAALLYGARSAFATEAESKAPPRVALLLPLNVTAFARLAESVRQGFAAAAQQDTGAPLDVMVYSTTDTAANVVIAYDQAIAEGARLIVGPLTRSGVSALLARVQRGTPVLTLNVPEGDSPLPDDVYAFSLQMEAEAKQIARMAFEDGRRTALSLSDEQPLSRRIQRAFGDEFARLGGRVGAEFLYRTSTSDLLALREAASSGKFDCAFVALNGARARLVRGYLDGASQIYATSQVLEGPSDRIRDAELNGVRFVGMPWLLQPDHAAVMVYARSSAATPAATDFERLYAFGIDAYRIADGLARGGDIATNGLDGVTGRITLGPDRHFTRELTPAQFVDGRAVPLAARP